MTAFYSNGYVTSIEQAILAEDLYFNSVQNVEGKFFIKVLTPMVDSSKLESRNKGGITSANYITLTIPAYLLLHFMNIEPITVTEGKQTKHVLGYNYSNNSQFKIPQGTIFFVEFLGGLVDADKGYIVGISQFSLVQ